MVFRCGGRSARGASAVCSTCALGSARGACAVGGLAAARRSSGGAFSPCLGIERCFQAAGPPTPEAVGVPLGVVVRARVLVTFVYVGPVSRPATSNRSRDRTSSPRPYAGSGHFSRLRGRARGLVRSRSESPQHSARTRSSDQPSVSGPVMAACAAAVGFMSRIGRPAIVH